MGIDHLAAYEREKARHKDALKSIERLHKLGLSRLKRLYGPVKERIEADVERQHAERLQEEEERHRRNVAALGMVLQPIPHFLRNAGVAGECLPCPAQIPRGEWCEPKILLKESLNHTAERSVPGRYSRISLSWEEPAACVRRQAI